MKSYTVKQYHDAGCRELTDIMLGVHTLSDGKVCDTGCHAFNKGRCSAYQKLTKPAHLTKNPDYLETVREEASRRGVSIKQVRRERRDEAYGVES